MISTSESTRSVYRTALESYLVSMARSVERSINRALEALLTGDEQAASAIFLLEPRVNEMEIVIDDHAVRMLRDGGLTESQLRHIVATIKINNDLERIGDLAVNIGQRVIALARLPRIEPPPELEPMCTSVRSMVGQSLGALIYQNLTLAQEVLEGEQMVDTYRDRAFDRLMGTMHDDGTLIGQHVQFLLATRHLERIADHTTNIAEDVVFWLRGLDIRHGRIRSDASTSPAAADDEL